MTEFHLDLKSSDTLKLHLKAEPFIDIIAGEGNRIPRLSIKIFEVKSKKKVYKQKKSLCDHVQQSCPLEHNDVVDINVKGKNLKLNIITYYFFCFFELQYAFGSLSNLCFHCDSC